MSAERQKVRFASGGSECAAWYYPGTTGACVVPGAAAAGPAAAGPVRR
jgi:hypothetical protein